MLKAILLLFMDLILAVVVTAQNLVPNPSFELVDSCFTPPDVLGYTPGHEPQDWDRFIDTPDYFNACQIAGSPGDVPNNVFTHQEAWDGIAYSGMFTYMIEDYREMIGAQLTSPLVVGQTYYASYYANAAFGGSEWPLLACDHFGLLFTMAPYPWQFGEPGLGIRNYAHVHSTEVISDTAAWTLVSGSFVADSAYQYVVVGNHFDNANTSIDTLGGNDTIPGLYRAYTLVDQICLSVNPEGCPLVQGAMEQGHQAMTLYPNPAVDQLTLTGLGNDASVTITDGLGRQLWEGMPTLGTLDLSVEGWARGWYVARVLNKAERRSIKFVLVE